MSGPVGTCREVSGQFFRERTERSGLVGAGLHRLTQVGTCQDLSGHVGTLRNKSGPVVICRDRSFESGRDR
jgi:hypothetical protein